MGHADATAIRPNEPLKYDFFGPQAEALRTQLRPGSILDVGRFFIPIRLRGSHPEDYVIKPDEVQLVPGEDGFNRLREYAEDVAFNSVHKLFPGMQKDNGLHYRPGKANNSRSVGYLRVKSVKFLNGSGELSALVVDNEENQFTAPVVGVDLLKDHPTFEKSLVRLSLSGQTEHVDWKETAHPKRCILMLSHVIKA